MLKKISKKAMKSIALAIPLIMCTDLANCMRHIEIPLSEAEKGILSHRPPQSEITSSYILSDHIPKDDHSREGIERMCQMYREVFYGDGKSEYSRCFKRYVENYMERFMSPEGPFSIDSYGMMCSNCLEYRDDLIDIYNKAIVRQYCAHLGGALLGLCYLLNPYEELDYFIQVLKESCFWFSIATVVDEACDGSLRQAIGELETALYMKTSKEDRERRSDKSKSCCDIL